MDYVNSYVVNNLWELVFLLSSRGVYEETGLLAASDLAQESEKTGTHVSKTTHSHFTVTL